jgi:archaellum biogenesis ATPase FlaH
MAAREIFNVRTIRERKYHTLSLGDSYNNLFGEPEAKFTAMCYGPSGSGKSVFTLQLANYIAANIGKVLYNSHEERVNQTIQQRIREYEINSEKLFFGNALSFETMMDKIRRNYYRVVVIDSVQYMQFTYEQFREMRAAFTKRHLGVIMVSFGSSEGNPDRAKDLLHASDIKLFFKSGSVKVVSRYTGKPVSRLLFRPQKDSTPTLF